MKFPMLKQRFEPYVDVAIFMVTMLVANALWKWSIHGDEWGAVVTFFGRDVTPVFEAVTQHVARMAYAGISLIKDNVEILGGHRIQYDTGVGTTVIWACSGIKQAFIWFSVMLTARHGWKHKLWYIPMGWVACYVFNILRIILLLLVIEHHPSFFYPVHDIILKYLYYGIMFGLWVIFVERIAPSSSPR